VALSPKTARTLNNLKKSKSSCAAVRDNYTECLHSYYITTIIIIHAKTYTAGQQRMMTISDLLSTVHIY